MDYCSNCGAELSPAAKFCTNCGAARAEEAVPTAAVQTELFEPTGKTSGNAAADVQPVFESRAAPVSASAPAPRKIENHLIKSVVATICCCLPFGIAGIIYAARVNTFLQQGNLAAAADASEKAGLWSTLSIAIGVLVNALVAVLMIIYQLKEGVL